jgi:hypothetical protein
MCLKENSRKDGGLFLNKIVKKRHCAFAIESIVLSLISLVSQKNFHIVLNERVNVCLNLLWLLRQVYIDLY